MRSTQQRWTWLGPIRVLLAVLIILDFLGLPIGALQLFNGQYPIGTVRSADLASQGTSPVTHPSLSLGGTQIMWHPTGAFQVVMFGLSHGLAFIIATLPMLGYAYHVTGDALRNDPFTLAMVRKLRTLGLLILVGGLACEGVAFAASWALLDDVLATQPMLRAGAAPDLRQYPSWWWLLPGLVVLAFAEVVRRGCYLRDELDGVI